jgi:regulatory protein
MTASGSPSPVAEAAEWLGRQGIVVPAPLGLAEPEPGSSVEKGVAGTGSAAAGSARPARSERARSGRPAQRRSEADSSAADRDADPEGGSEADPYAVARSIALDRIAARDRTRHELAKALQAKNVPAEVAEQVLDRLQEVGLINDAAFAEAWVESRQQRRHLSRPALRRELQAKGVDRDEIDAALESVDVGDELAAARDLARRKHASIAARDYAVRYRRLAGALSRRGFGSAIVTQVLREVLGEQ